MILQGDSLVRLKELPDNSIDSIVTDPPYGLSFMGKKWDYDVPSKELWAECLRVLKPGGHLLSFGGTRTYHRLVSAIEDAGFEIRDQIQWIYGSGFPKSMDISKAIDKQAGVEREIVEIKAAGSGPLKRGHVASTGGGMSVGTERSPEYMVTAPATDDAKRFSGWGTALKPANEIVCLARKPLTVVDELTMLVRELCQSQLFANVAKKILESNQSESNEALNIAQWLAGESTLTQDALFALMDMSQSKSATSLNLSIEYSWLSILAEILARESTFTTETASSLITDLKILKCLLSKLTQESIIQAETNQHGQPCNVSLVKNLFFAVSTKLNFILTPSALENATSRDIVLSPNSEPICVARKPLSESTVAKNVLKWGTGALNIDGSRIGSSKRTPGYKNPGNEYSESGEWNQRYSSIQRECDVNQGRWPANIILDEFSAKLLDEQTQHLHGAGFANTLKGNKTQGNIFQNSNDVTRFGDTGGASRFFYCAKASKSERNAGLEGMPLKKAGIKNDSGRGFSETNPHKEILMQNFHPTVKPIKLMEYLIKLVTPEGGTVLDPFMGSGSTGVAAANLGFSFIGCELSPEYFEIAKKRIERAM